MKQLTLISVFLCFMLNPSELTAKPHKFEDGFVERSVAVVVRDRIAIVEYSIGLNEATVRSLLDGWNSDSTQKSTQEEPLVPQTPANHGSRLLPENKTTQKKPETPLNPTPDTKFETPNAEGGHSIDPELLKKFKLRAPNCIAQGLEISCNEEPVEIASITQGPAPRHPFMMTIKFQFKIPDHESCSLKLNDTNFRKQTGAVRYALKTAGNSMLMQSNVAPILVRAERFEIAKLSQAERISHTSIIARLGFVSPKND